jgi:hypothetical protein
MKDVYLLYLITPANSLGLEGKYLLACYSDVHNLVKRMKNGLYSYGIKDTSEHIYCLLTDPYDGHEVYEFGRYIVERRPLY